MLAWKSIKPAWKSMKPPDEIGQHVRHCKTHRNAFVLLFGQTSTVENENKMLVYCPDKNCREVRWKTAFYKVPNSPIRLFNDDDVLTADIAGKHGKNIMEEVWWHNEEEHGTKNELGYMWSTSGWKMQRYGDFESLQLDVPVEA